jgi:hypothetical protein
MYNSCYPQVAYSINVLALGGMTDQFGNPYDPLGLGTDYSGFEIGIGDKTWVEDEEFFGRDENGNIVKEPVTITEISENLDSPDKNLIKVQNFKT